MKNFDQELALDEEATATSPVSDRFIQALEALNQHLTLYSGPERQRQAFKLLDGLTAVVQRDVQPSKSMEEVFFSPVELTKSMRWGANDKSEAKMEDPLWAGRTVSRNWNNIHEIYENLEPGYIQRCRDQGLTHYLAPEKHASRGGTGQTSRYGFTLKPLESRPTREKTETGEIRFQPEWVERFSAPLLGIGFAIKGWVSLVVAGVGILLILLMLIPLVIFAMAMKVEAWNAAGLAAVVSLGSAYLLKALTNPALEAKKWRVIMAPAWLRPILSIEPMQLVYEPKDNIIRAVRYTAVCPKCGGRVLVDDGGKRFPDQLVGRCRENPRVHVFEFNHSQCQTD